MHWLGQLSGFALALLPLAMAVAHRSAPLVLVISAVLALAARAAEGSFGELRSKLGSTLRSPTGAGAVGFLALSAVSIAWSPAPALSLYAWGEFVLPAAAALVLALTLPARLARSAFIVLAVTAAAAAVLILFELATGQEARHALGMRWNTFVFNRPALTLLVLAPPLLAALFRLRHRWLGIALGLLIVAAILRSDSGAAVLGLTSGAAAFAIARRAPATALNLTAAALVIAFAVAPVSGEILNRLLPPSIHHALYGASSQARVDIWRSFGAAVRERPVFGTGFASGPAVPASQAGSRVDPGYRTFLSVGHPHNAALQIWVELGAIGAFAAAAVLLLVLRALATLPPESFAPSLALFAAVAAVSVVAHGAWQGWWSAVIGAAIVWFCIARETTMEARR